MSVSRGRKIGSGGGPAKKKGTTAGLTGLVVQCWLLINSSLLAAAQTVYSSTTGSNYGGVGITDVGDISRPGPASNTPATNSDKKYLLYRVPPFEASLTFPDPGFQNHLGQTALMDIDESLDGITSRYLFDFVFRYMEGLSRQHKRPLAQRLHSLEVQADLYEVDEKGNIVGCDHLTAVMAPFFLAEAPGAAVVYDLRSSKAVEEEILKAAKDMQKSGEE